MSERGFFSSLLDIVVIRSSLAILAGYICYTLLTVITILILSSNFPSYVASSRSRPPFQWALINLAQSFLFSGVASAVTTYLGSGVHESWIFACILFIIGLAYLLGPKPPSKEIQTHKNVQISSPGKMGGLYHMSLVMASVSGLLLGEHIFENNREQILKSLNL